MRLKRASKGKKNRRNSKFEKPSSRKLSFKAATMRRTKRVMEETKMRSTCGMTLVSLMKKTTRSSTTTTMARTRRGVTANFSVMTNTHCLAKCLRERRHSSWV